MNFISRIVFLSVLLAVISACTTTGTFKVPEGTDLYINNRPQPVEIKPDGKVTTRPYFWSAIGIAPKGGVPYRLEKDGQVVKEGKLRSVFRGVSLLWPPYAIFYWPVGLNPHITYDLVNDKQE